MINSPGLARQKIEAGIVGEEVAFVPGASIVRLTLTDFRCYVSQRIETGPAPVILSGPNGAGKTNVLEALSFLVPGRGLRSAKLADISRRAPASSQPSDAPWAVAAKLQTRSGAIDVGTGRGIQPGDKREKRVVHIDGAPVRSQALLAEHLSAQWLTPQMDRLFLEGASARRRFLDRLVFGADPAHAGRVSAYEHAMRERARLLRHGQHDSGRPADPQWLSVLEQTMASKGVAVSAARLDMVARLDEAAGQAAADGAFPGAAVSVTGSLEQWLESGPALEAEERLKKTLEQSRRADSEGATAPVGPHRSDMAVCHLGNGQAAEMCSTGEQKALLIALILANARLQGAERGTLPLLLLDEVAAHLDETRREALFEEILRLGIQAWMTGTDTALFAPLRGEAQFFGVADAVITPA
ncbi:MAG: DNA replication/repair protein RecF [Rhodospirillales bacterium]|nr:DNA replication/repair protein RecF [Rhodospirillales bacterium]